MSRPRSQDRRKPARRRRPKTDAAGPGTAPEKRPTGTLRESDRQLLAEHLKPLVKPHDLPETTQRLERYFCLLLDWNRRSNLISAGDESRVIERHALDSLLVVPVIDEVGGRTVLDLGTGGGLPGIPLKIVRPELQVTLLDSRRMKSLFLLRATSELGLTDVRVWRLRAEQLRELPARESSPPQEAPGASGRTPAVDSRRPTVTGLGGPGQRPEFEVVTTRAVATLAQVTAWAAPLMVPGGHLIAYKGSRLDEELSNWRATPGAWRLLDVRRDLRPRTHLVILRRI